MKKITVLFGLSLFVLSCAAVKVNYDYEQHTDFATYKSYNYYDGIGLGMSELYAGRLFEALDVKLQAKGLHLSDTPDFLIHIKSSTFQEGQRNNVGVGLGGGGGSIGGGISIGIPIGQSKVNREIVFEFVDESRSGLFWQAVSVSAYQPNAKPEVKEAQFEAIVEKVLSEYPPATKK